MLHALAFLFLLALAAFGLVLWIAGAIARYLARTLFGPD